VGGVVGGFALLGLVGFLFWRRRRNAKSNPYAPAESHNAPSYDAYAYPPGELASPVGEIDSGQTYYHEAPITEKYGHNAVNPVAEVSAGNAPVELPAERHYEK
jgi:MYXO-CTERM domain-containing protein